MRIYELNANTTKVLMRIRIPKFYSISIINLTSMLNV